MSRPSTTMPPSSPMISRCRRSNRARTSGTVLTGLTAAVTSADRMGPPTSTPSTVIVGASGSVPEAIVGSWHRAATAAASWTSTPCCRRYQVIARNWAPVSR
jgi:hypothetical protein